MMNEPSVSSSLDDPFVSDLIDVHVSIDPSLAVVVGPETASCVSIFRPVNGRSTCHHDATSFASDSGRTGTGQPPITAIYTYVCANDAAGPRSHRERNFHSLRFTFDPVGGIRARARGPGVRPVRCVLRFTGISWVRRVERIVRIERTYPVFAAVAVATAGLRGRQRLGSARAARRDR